MAVQNIKVNIGSLNTPIDIQRFKHLTDEYGFTTPIWTTIVKARCKIDFDDRLIRQIIRDDGVDTTTVKLFTMRYIPNITTKDRIFYKNTAYEIYSVQNLNDNNRFMRLWGRELDPIT